LPGRAGRTNALFLEEATWTNTDAVADEVRKLAENAGKPSESIGSTMEDLLRRAAVMLDDSSFDE
jgi:hypothetical protein